MTATLPTADRRQDRDLRADEDVDVAAQLTLLVEDAVAHPGMPIGQRGERVAHRLALHLDAHGVGASGEAAPEPRQAEGHRHARVARTQRIGGSPSASALQDSPSSRDANTLPLRVPK